MKDSLIQQKSLSLFFQIDLKLATFFYHVFKIKGGNGGKIGF